MKKNLFNAACLLTAVALGVAMIASTHDRVFIAIAGAFTALEAHALIDFLTDLSRKPRRRP